ncbi:Lrrc40 protein, partial [Blyttiomyces helicus]
SLDLSSNQIRSIPATASPFPSLNELNVSHNRLATLPASLPTQFPMLAILLATGNGIAAIDPAPLRQMSSLAVLDLSNNAIVAVPPELGLCTALRSLQLDGNLFRVPRRQILEKGTDAILAYLRDRIVA